MRIVHVTATFPPYRSGTGNVVYHNARVLAERGHDVTVLTGGRLESKREGFPFAVHYLKAPIRAGNAAVTPGLLRRLVHYDIIHLHYPFIIGAELTALAALRKHVSWTVTYHQDLLGPGVRGQLFTVYGALSRHVLCRATRVFATSLDYAWHSDLRYLLNRGIEVRAMPNGVDTDVFSPGAVAPHRLDSLGLDQSESYVLFVGALDRAHYFKGLPQLMRAMRDVPSSVRLVVVGDGDMRRTYEIEARHTLPERASFLGSIGTDALVDLYGAALVTVLPSVTRGEAFGLVLLESLACGTPVIASNLPGVRTVPQDGVDGFLVPAGDVSGLAGRIAFLNSSPETARRMGASGRARVERMYSWSTVGDLLELEYADIVSTGAARVRLSRTAQAEL